MAAVPVSEQGEGTTPGHEAISVLAVDAGSGKERWTAEVAVSADVANSNGQGVDTQVVAVADEAVVVTYTSGGSIFATSTTAALDPSTRDALAS